MSRKKNIFFVGLMVSGLIICILILINLYYSSDSLTSNIYFKRTPLENLIQYKYISGDISGLTPVDIDLNNVYINNNTILTTSFHQNNPSENFNVKIINDSKNHFTIYQLLNGKNTGVYNLTLNNNNLNGTFTDLTNNRKYNFNSVLTNYTNAILTSNIEHTYSSAMDNLFLEYPIHTGNITLDSGSANNKSYSVLIEYNQYTNKIIEYTPSKSNVILTLKLVKPVFNSGIRLSVSNGNTLIGYMNLYYNNNDWSGDFSPSPTENAPSYILKISGHY